MEVVPSASGTYDYTLAPLNKALEDLPTTADSKMINKVSGSLPPWKEHCSTCSGDKYFKTRLRDGSIVTCECNCREQWILLRRMQAANIDNVYARMSWERAVGVLPVVADRVREYVGELDLRSSVGLGLTLYSDRRGTGKTLLTSLILKEAMAQGKSVFFARFYDLIDLYAKTWKDDTAEAWFVRKVERADFLGIDDIGKENRPEKGNSAAMVDQLLDRMLRGRIANNRVNVVNSNLNPEASLDADRMRVERGFESYLQDVLELLSEVNETIEVGGLSYRKNRQQQKLADARDGVVYPVVVR